MEVGEDGDGRMEMGGWSWRRMEMGGWIEVEGVWMRTTWISSQRKERVKTALSSLVLGVEESELLQCKDHYNVIFISLGIWSRV